MTIGIYIRVSTLEQASEGYSISAQKERLLAFCVAQGWNDYKFYVDEGVSAKDTNRPQLKMLMKHVKEGKISTILVYRLDRFTRRVKDLHKMLEYLEHNKCAFKSATEPYDTSTAMGKLFITIVAALAEWETDNLSERVKMALEEKVSGGERVGNVPFGFDLTEEDKLKKNKKQAQVILDMVEKIKNGMSASQLANYLTTHNDDRAYWHTQAVLRVLRNPALYGATRWNDKIFEHTHDHEAILSKSEFIKLQQMLDDRSIHRLRNVKSTYLFQGVLKCPECKKIMSVNRYIRKRKNGSSYQGAIYRCQNCYKNGHKVSSIGEARIIEALYTYMKNVNIENTMSPEPQNDGCDEYLNQLKQIEKKREKYQRAWASDLMSDEEFTKLMNETRDVYEDLKGKLNNRNEQKVYDTESIKGIVFSFNEGFFNLSHDEKRLFIAQFIRSIDFQLHTQAPQRPDRAKNGKPQIIITDVDFY